MNFCRECGNKLQESGMFCEKCGAKYELIGQPKNYTKKKTNGLSVLGMILGIVSLSFSMWGIISIIAIIVSSVARKQIIVNDEAGDGMAVAGICCGIISLLLLVMVWGFMSCV